VFKYNDDYSWLTQLPIGEETIEVEHSVIASDEDIERLGLPDGEYLFFSITVEASQISHISVEHHYEEDLLESAGAFIFRSHRLESGELDRTKPNWIVSKYEGQQLNETFKYGFVKVYKVPKTAWVSPFVPKAFWFRAPLVEKITLESDAEDSEKTYVFELKAEWHKASTLGQVRRVV